MSYFFKYITQVTFFPHLLTGTSKSGNKVHFIVMCPILIQNGFV